MLFRREYINMLSKFTFDGLKVNKNTSMQHINTEYGFLPFL